MSVFTQPGMAAAVVDVTPTDEQQAIVDAYRGGGDLVIQAGAGTGKTSTLRMLAAADPGRRGVYLAFNRAIADHAAGTFPANMLCATAHSLAYRAVGHRYRKRLNGPRLPARETARILGVPPVVDVGTVALTAAKAAHIVADTVRQFCYSTDARPGPGHVPRLPGLDDPLTYAELQQVVTPLAARAWVDLTSEGGRLRFEHDHYLKLWALTRPRLDADVVMLDEAQDANPVIAGIVADQAHTQRVLVGDTSQAIYAWRGAVNAMTAWTGQQLTLSRSFRFGPAIAGEANKWLRLLDAPLRLAGNPDIASTVGPASGGVVLCRGNARVISETITALDAGRRVAVVGDGTEIRRLAEAAAQLRAGLPCHHPELVAFDTWQQLREYAENDSAGGDLRPLVRIIDTHGPERIVRVCDQLVPERHADLVVSTAHKAKGREWPAVRVAGDFPEPEPAPDADGPPEVSRDEAMLAYVTVTRARDTLDRSGLAWVDNWTSPPTPPSRETPVTDDTATPPPATVELPGEAGNWVSLYREADAAEKHWAEIKKRAREHIEHLMGDAEHGHVNGVLTVRWPHVTSRRLDTKKLREQAPDLVDECTVDTVSRRFTIT